MWPGKSLEDGLDLGDPRVGSGAHDPWRTAPMLPKPERTELHASYQDLLLPTTLRLLDIQAHRLAAQADNLPLRAIELTVHALRRFTSKSLQHTQGMSL